MNVFQEFDYTKDIPSPAYVVEEKLLRQNLELIKSVQEKAQIEIIMAFKANALWKTFPIIREYIPYSTASSLNEARLALEAMGHKAHTYAPIYTEKDFNQIAACSSQITFNSVAQYLRFGTRAKDHKVSCGLRINPEYSVVETDLYNPCAPGSRLGITAQALGDHLPQGIEGFHFHTLCESNALDLEKTFKKVEEKFGAFFADLKWLNMGGGHLMTRQDYDVEYLINFLKGVHEKYPHLRLILEPGSAFTWRTGVLVTSVEDIVENHGIRTAIINASFACHMPDCLEMPYQPDILGAQKDQDKETQICATPEENKVLPAHSYRIGGNSCLSGDVMGSWHFPRDLKIGERLVFEDMNHYTTVKTTFFNGVQHPAILLRHSNGSLETLRTYTYEDFKAHND